MADEELAEKYAYEKWTDYPEKQEIAEQAFLAGLKAGRPEWHNLKENPTDLPKEFDLIRKAFGVYPEKKSPHIVMNQDGESVYCVRTIGNKQKAWYWAYADDDLGLAPEPIAWTELPKFEEE